MNRCIDNSIPMGTEINIRGRIYRINLTGDQAIERTKIFSREKKSCIRNTPFPSINRIGQRRLMKLCWVYVDDLLGEGACERYFGGRQCNWNQMMDLLSFLADEMEKHRKERR